MLTRLLVASLVAIAASPTVATGTGGPPTAPVSQSTSTEDRTFLRPEAFDVVTLADGVYALLRRDPPDDAAIANVMVIVNERDVVVVDATLTPSSTAAVVAAIRRLSPLPVRYVINTHWHDDHILGNSVYRDAFPDVEFIGHPFTRQQVLDTVAPALEKNRALYRDEVATMDTRLAAGTTAEGTPMTADDRQRLTRRRLLFDTFLVEMPHMRITAPTMLVTDQLTLQRGEREIRVLYLGRGNTAGDLVVHLPRERIVATGDLLVHPVPFSFGSFLGDWMGTLDRVRALDAAVIMPGHGALQRDTAYLESVRTLLDAMRRQMQAAVDRGLSLEEARAALDLDEFRRRFTGGDPIRTRQFTQFFVIPASERAYREAKGELR